MSTVVQIRLLQKCFNCTRSNATVCTDFKGVRMRIDELVPKRKIAGETKDTNRPQKSSIITSLFSLELHQKEMETTTSYELEIEEYRKEIDYTGDMLEKEPTIGNFTRYRDALSKLAKRITNEAYRLEKCGGTPQNPRYFEIITTINAEADKLYNLIVQKQKNNMAITAKVIGIKGLVVDLIT